MMQFISFITYIVLIVIVLIRNPYGRSNRFAAGLFLCFAVWSFGEIFLYNPLTPGNLVIIFEKIEVPGWASFPVFLFWFLVSLTDKKKLYNSAALKTLSIAIPVFFIALHWSGNLMQRPELMRYYWHSDWRDNSVFPYLYFTYYLSSVIAGLVYYSISLKKNGQVFKKKQAVVLFTSTAITLVLGTFFEVIKPMLHMDAGLFDYFNDMYLLIWAISLFIIIFKYRFLALTPATASESIISAMNEALLLLDDEVNISFVNRPALEMLGYKNDELIGVPFFKIIYNPELTNAFLKEVIIKRKIKSEEFVLKRRDGSPLACLFSASLVMELGEMRGIVCVASDITALLDAESGMREERDKAQKYLDELKVSYDQLKQLDILKSNFTAMVSHEIRTPITSIKGFTSFLLGGVGGKLSPQQQEFMHSIKSNTDRLLTLINDLLDTSKMESGSFSINKEQTDILGIIRSGINDVHSISENKNICITMETGLNICSVMIDPYRISQALVNLLNNAIKFSASGTVISITVDRMDLGGIEIPAYVKKSYIKPGSYVKIAIIDHGKGIEPDKINRVFDKYYQVEDINTRKTQGTGLGLNIVKNIVQLHGGTVWAESKGIGLGSAFVFIIPEE
jgi:PAS domain S-box-containing protein